MIYIYIYVHHQSYGTILLWIIIYIYISIFGDFIDDFSTIWEHRLGFVRNLSGFPTFGGVSYDGGSPVSHHGFQY